MLLFLLHDNFRERPRGAREPSIEVLDEARALFAAGLFLSAWCVLRLLAAYGHGFSADVVLAVPCLLLGVESALRGAGVLRAARRGPHATQLALRQALCRTGLGLGMPSAATLDARLVQLDNRDGA